MTTTRPPVSISRFTQAAVVPGLHLDTALLTFTAHQAGPRAVVIALRGEVDLCTSPLLLPLRITGLDGLFDILPTSAHALRGPERMAL